MSQIVRAETTDLAKVRFTALFGLLENRGENSPSQWSIVSPVAIPSDSMPEVLMSAGRWGVHPTRGCSEARLGEISSRIRDRA